MCHLEPLNLSPNAFQKFPSCNLFPVIITFHPDIKVVLTSVSQKETATSKSLKFQKKKMLVNLHHVG